MSEATSQAEDEAARLEHQQPSDQPGLCCQYLRQGKCTTPRPPCRLRHDPDDGSSPCFYGACCRNGHKNRVLGGMTVEERLAFWRDFNARRGTLVAAYENPAERDVTLLRSQLEPWSTAHLRIRLASVFGEDDVAMDALPRGQVMQRLLQHYENPKSGKQRKTVRVLGKPVDPSLCDQLLIHLHAWSKKHTVNSRPSICATNYMILRSPSEFAQRPPKQQQPQQSPQDSDNDDHKNQAPAGLSKKGRIAAKKLREHQVLWDLAKEALATVDPTFADSFSALAVTKGFRGSPHIDKQNTGPFYGLSLGTFDDGTGGVCVEADAFTVAHVNTKGRLAKVDGRYPHWVAPYTYNNLDDEENNSTTTSSKEEKDAQQQHDDSLFGQQKERYRYSLIYYSTKHSYSQPGPAYFGELVEDNDPNVRV